MKDVIADHHGIIMCKLFSGYSAGHASTVGSVLVTNLKTGVRKGGCDKAEVLCCSHTISNVVLNVAKFKFKVML